MNITIVAFILQIVAHFSHKEQPAKPQQPQQEIIYRALDIPDNELVERQEE